MIKALALVVSIATAAPHTAAPLIAGELAPFSGVLLSEQRLIELLEAETERGVLAAKLNASESYAVAIEKIYIDRLKLAGSLGWYEHHKLWIGFGIGMLTAGAAIYAGARIVEVGGQ